MTAAPTLRSLPIYRPAHRTTPIPTTPIPTTPADHPDGAAPPAASPAAEASTLIVSVQISVPRDTPAAERVFDLADRLHSLAVDGADAARVSPAARSVSPPAQVPELVLLADRRIALLDGRPVHLTRLEYDLLLYLAESAGRVLTRGQLLRQVWGYGSPGGGRTVDVHIRRLRAKLRGRGPAISTVRGIGYRMDRATRVAVVRDRG
jgi:DNA-binding winged helix-turn-helix (wHTH) protein